MNDRDFEVLLQSVLSEVPLECEDEERVYSSANATREQALRAANAVFLMFKENPKIAWTIYDVIDKFPLLEICGRNASVFFNHLAGRVSNEISHEETMRDLIMTIGLAAVNYFEREFLERCQYQDLATMLVKVKAEREETSPDFEEYKYYGLHRVEIRLGKEVERLNEEARIRARISPQIDRQDLGASEIAVNSTTNRITNREKLIAVRYFVDHYRLRHIDKINFARLLAVLNNGKNVDQFRQDFDSSDLITPATIESATKVAHLCRQVRLDGVADEIEKSIGRLNRKDL